MGPTTTFCPHMACLASGQIGQGTIGVHTRKDQRFMGTQCRKTCTATKGTALYRVRTAAETVTLVLTLLAHGCLLQAIVIAFGFDGRTVASWCARAGGQGHHVPSPRWMPPKQRGRPTHALKRLIERWCGDHV